MLEKDSAVTVEELQWVDDVALNEDAGEDCGSGP